MDGSAKGRMEKSAEADDFRQIEIAFQPDVVDLGKVGIPVGIQFTCTPVFSSYHSVVVLVSMSSIVAPGLTQMVSS